MWTFLSESRVEFIYLLISILRSWSLLLVNIWKLYYIFSLFWYFLNSVMTLGVVLLPFFLFPVFFLSYIYSFRISCNKVWSYSFSYSYFLYFCVVIFISASLDMSPVLFGHLLVISLFFQTQFSVALKEEKTIWYNNNKRHDAEIHLKFRFSSCILIFIRYCPKGLSGKKSQAKQLSQALSWTEDFRDSVISNKSECIRV